MEKKKRKGKLVSGETNKLVSGETNKKKTGVEAEIDIALQYNKQFYF